MSFAQVPALCSDIEFASEDRLAIEAISQNLERIWNQHQIDQLTPLLTADAEFINPVGMWWRGRVNIVRALAAFHSTIFRQHTLRQLGLETRPITANVAIAIHTQRSDAFVTPEGVAINEELNRWTMVFVKRGGHWLIASGQATPINEQAECNNPIQAI